MSQFDHPMFKPLWVRILIVLICVAWGGFEMYNNNTFWAVLFWGVGAYSVYTLFIRFNSKEPDNKEDGP